MIEVYRYLLIYRVHISTHSVWGPQYRFRQLFIQRDRPIRDEDDLSPNAHPELEIPSRESWELVSLSLLERTRE